METAVWQEYNQEVSVVGIINTSSQNQINTFVTENSITFPILFDPGSSGGVQGGDTYDTYFARVRSIIDSNKRYPVVSRQRQQAPRPRRS